MAVLKDSHQTSPKVLLKWWLSLKVVIKHRPKFCWSDGCLWRLSSNIAQSSTEVMAVLKDCHQTSPKILLKWWLSLKIVIKHRPKFCCVFCLCFLSVFSLCVFSLCFLSVFSLSVCSLCVFSVCVFSLCFLSVICVCVFCVCVCLCVCVFVCVWLCVCVSVCVRVCFSVCSCVCVSLINGLVENAWILVCFKVWERFLQRLSKFDRNYHTSQGANHWSRCLYWL